jgi:predicted amidophosphoribosyltransferase
MSLRYCPTDKKHKVFDSDRYCEECGKKTVQILCSKGHERFSRNAKFCWSCGVKLDPLKDEDEDANEKDELFKEPQPQEDLIGWTHLIQQAHSRFRKGEDPF